MFGQGKGPPGGLSINTAAANSTPTTSGPPSLSLNPPKSGGMFGSSASAAASAGTLFSTSTSTAGAAGSLFGNTASAPSQAGTLFGGAATATPTAAGSLFSSTTTQPQNTAIGAGSLFGNTTTTSAGGSLFGGTTTTSAPSNPFGSLAASKSLGQPAQSTGLFGSLGTSQPQQQSTSLFPSLGGGQTQTGGMSLFGQPAQQQQQQGQTGSLFGLGQGQNQGQQQQQQQNNAASMFGASAQTAPRNVFQTSNISTLGPGQQPQRSIFSASIGQYTQATQTVPGVRINLDNLRPTTRFEDLHEDIQRAIAALDGEILRQMTLADECAQALPTVARVGTTIPPDVTLLETKLDATRTALLNDAAGIDAAKKQVRADASDAQRSFHTIAALRMPTHMLGRGAAQEPAVAGDPGDPNAAGSGDGKQGLVPYFATQADTMNARLAQMQRHLGEVEAYLAGLESQTAQQVQNLRLGRGGAVAGDAVRARDARVRELAAVLREFEQGILTVASSVGQARESVQEAQLAEADGPRWRR